MWKKPSEQFHISQLGPLGYLAIDYLWFLFPDLKPSCIFSIKHHVHFPCFHIILLCSFYLLKVSVTVFFIYLFFLFYIVFSTKEPLKHVI